MSESFSPELTKSFSLVSESSTVKIKNTIQSISKAEKIESTREQNIFGETFEILAQEENHQRHPETQVQKDLRGLIENIYQNAELVIGTSHETPSKPDGVSVTFDKNGKLVIDEIVELKSSNSAYLHGVDKNQPAKTIETIGAIVTILNRLKKGEETTNISPKEKDLSINSRIKRNIELKRIKEQVIAITGDKEPITFSPDMIYRIIVPKEEWIPQYKPNLLEDLGYAIKVEISHSNYSKKDVHQIINNIKNS
jgi:hypothetical protein